MAWYRLWRPICRLSRTGWTDRFHPLGSLRRIASGLRDAANRWHKPRLIDALGYQVLQGLSETAAVGRTKSEGNTERLEVATFRSIETGEGVMHSHDSLSCFKHK